MGRKYEDMWRVKGEGYGKKNRRTCVGLKMGEMGRRPEIGKKWKGG